MKRHWGDWFGGVEFTSCFPARLSSLSLQSCLGHTNGDFAHPIDKNCGIVWLVTWRVLGFSISSDAQASRVVELTVHQRESEASMGDMLCGANSACLCRATRKPIVTTDFVVQADDAPMPTCLRRDRKKIIPHLISNHSASRYP